jgi:signal transduction histidine kinase
MRTDQRSGTDRRENRRSQQASLRTIVDRMADGIVIVGLDGVVRFSNPAAQQLFGRSAADLEGTHLGYPVVVGESFEIEIVRPDDVAVSAELRVVALEWDGVPAHLVSLRDTTERKRAEERASQLEEERLARAEAEMANRTKSEFLAMMSHELRTPLNAVIGYAELLQLGIPGALTEEQLTQVSRILTSARHLLGLVNEVLDLARIDAGRLSVERGAASTSVAIEAAVAVVHPSAEARGVSVEVKRDSLPAAVYEGDESRVRQILVNLLTNAIKFTEPGGRVLVESGVAQRPASEARLSGLGPWVYVRVDDTGVGIPSDRLAAIFDPFVQVDTSHTRPTDGSGLGLTICRRLARLMNGDVSVRSEVGRGSSFTLWLPAASAQGPDATMPPTPLERRQTRLHGVADVGEVLLGELGTVTSAFVSRLRAERIIPSADSLGFSQLADHAATYVADVAVMLIAAEESRGEPTSLVSGASEIQRLIAERHGTRRARLGWSRETLAREWTILREEIERAVRGHTASIPPNGLGEALTLIGRFMGQAEDVSARALTRAGRETEIPEPSARVSDAMRLPTASS